MKPVSKLLLAAAALALAAGCENQAPRPKTTQAPASAGASAGPSADSTQAPALKVSPEDTELTKKVKSALAGDAAVRDKAIEVDSNAGVVILKGQVEADETKQRIQQLAQEVPGVKWVQNQITVAPPPKTG
jgi:hyperosmotically inducible periplasmic protein